MYVDLLTCFEYHSNNVRFILEYGPLPVYDLGRSYMSGTMHQLDRLKQEQD